MTRELTRVHKDEPTNSIVCEIAGKKIHIPAEHAEEVHELLGDWLEEQEDG